MNEDHDSYRPRSPDLSSYTPQPPPDPTYNTNAYQQNYSLAHRGSYDASPYFSPQTATIPQSYFNALSHASPQPLPSRASIDNSALYPQFNVPQPPPAIVGDQRLYTERDPSTNFDTRSQRHPDLHFLDTKMARRRKSEEIDDDYTPGAQNPSGGRMAKRARKDDSSESTVIPILPSKSGPSQGIDVKTKFPVARIKRIMQADEDVGKLAMAAPIAVSKALELFMISLVTKAATEAREKSSKRVTAMHIKQAVEKDQNFDFLMDTISKISEQPEGKKGSKARSESPDPAEDAKRKKGGGRKKKTESED